MKPKQTLTLSSRWCLNKTLSSPLRRIKKKEKIKLKLSQRSSKNKLQRNWILKLLKPLQWVLTQTSLPTSLLRCGESSSKTNPSEQPIQEHLSPIGRLNESQKPWMSLRSLRQFKTLASEEKCYRACLKSRSMGCHQLSEQKH